MAFWLPESCHEPAPYTGSIPPDGTAGTKAVARQMRARPSRTVADQGELPQGRCPSTRPLVLRLRNTLIR